MNCTFYNQNTYMLRFIQYGDNCQESLFSKEKYSVCQKLIDYNIRVEDSNRVNLSSIFYIVISFYCLLIMMILICLFKETDCLKDNTLKLHKTIFENKNLFYENENLFEDEEYEDDTFNIFNYYLKEIKGVKPSTIDNYSIKKKKKNKYKSNVGSDLSSERNLEQVSNISKSIVQNNNEDISIKFETNYSKLSKKNKIMSESTTYKKTFNTKFKKK